MGEDGAGGEVGALLEADRLHRGDQPGEVARADQHVDVAGVAPLGAQPRQDGRALEVEQVDAGVVGELLDDGVGEVDTCGDGRRPYVRLLAHAAIVPAAPRRVSANRPGGRGARPTLASMTFGDFVRLSRAYVWVLIGCTILGALLMIGKTTRDPVLYSATSSGLVRVGPTRPAAGEEQSNATLAEDKANLYAFLV